MIENENYNGLICIGNYTFWTKAVIVYPFIKSYLKNLFPDSLIVSEFNRIDLVVVNEELPIEIQSSQMTTRKEKKALCHTEFEDSIRRQLEDNIENYGKCWFFFDAEYYRYLNENNINVSFNLDWMSKYVKDNKLKIFTIKHDGIIKELQYSDLEFIRKLSNTCKIEYENDERILNRNKIKIFRNVLNGYRFTQDEIDIFRDNYNEREKDKDSLSMFLIKSLDSRKRLYGYILQTMGSLTRVNTFLDGEMNTDSNGHGSEKIESIYLGIFNKDERNKVCFIDKFNICQYFPFYQRNKEVWKKFKENEGYFDNYQLREVYKLYKNNEKTIFDY